MIIDCHTHIFPEQIAGKTIKLLSESADVCAHTDGTLKGLKESMLASSVDFSVVLPVVTNPASFERVNEYAMQLNEEPGIISFAGIHPSGSLWKEELNRIVQMGFKGIKLHPNYQGVEFASPVMKRLVYRASELGLIISVHAGIDIGQPDYVYCTPKMAEEVLDEVKPEKLVLAHFGGWKMWNEVEARLVGRDVYFDTAFTLEYLGEEQMIRMFQKHGIDKILFATDSPWSSQADYVSRIQTMKLTKTEKKKILSENAIKLLNIH